eukprot:CAMPEP_0116853698 /NCGR_PEP_ID=MMETSP0418-20121206/18085_1 /TAXON_ID=1158023 /ORGANISM="Astrosyne radiata, Strain 13vi08-1A" /LENGTH=235 /DNA_ID=CAMNT_0004486185 /DNA_START=42 /DNA_END=749 /DNA_ORIENTATION=-
MVVEKGDDDEDRVIVADSDEIFEWLDQNILKDEQQKFCPTPEIRQLSLRATRNTLAGAVLYYNWVDNVGYQRTMQKSISEMAMPTWVPGGIRTTVVDWFTASEREKYRQKVAEMTKLDELDEPKIRTLLKDELLFFQSMLKEKDEGLQEGYFQDFEKPSALDFAVYAQVERLVGNMGDVALPASIPEFRDETQSELKMFWAWYDFMRRNHPIRFKGKRPPPTKKSKSPKTGLFCS